MKKKYIALGIAIVVVAVAAILAAPPIISFKSYEGFLKMVLKVKNLQIESFEAEPDQPQFPGSYVFGATDPAKITRNTDISKSSDQLTKFNILPLSSFRFIRAQEYFNKNYSLYPVGVNGVEGFPGEFYLRFYESPNHVLTMVVLQYMPEINRKMLLSGFGSPIEMGIDGIGDSLLNTGFRSEVLKYLGGNKLNTRTSVSMYTGRHFIASIFYFIPKTDNTEENTQIGETLLRFERGLLKTLYIS